jgi:hypothetical protein
MLWKGRRESSILLQRGEASDMLQAGAKGVLLQIWLVGMWLSGQHFDGKRGQNLGRFTGNHGL